MSRLMWRLPHCLFALTHTRISSVVFQFFRAKGGCNPFQMHSFTIELTAIVCAVINTRLSQTPACVVLDTKSIKFLACGLVMAEAGTWYELPTKAGAADYDNIAPEVKDLVRMSKKAHIVGRGHLMWMCWQPCGAGSKPFRVNSISSGAMPLHPLTDLFSCA